MTTLSLGIAAQQDTVEIEKRRYFFDVSILKLVIMSAVTLTFYQVYWFYRNWKLARERGDDVIPILRAIFGVLFAYALFKEVREKGRSAKLPLALSAGGLAWLYFFLQMTWRLPDPAWLAGYATILPLAIVQRDVARLHLSLGLDPNINSKLTWKNIVGIVLGGLFLLLTMIGLALPDPGV